MGFSRKFWDLNLRRGTMYNEHTLKRSFLEVIGFSICSMMHRLWAANYDATLKGLARQAQRLLEQQGGHRKTTEKEGKRTELIKNNTKVPNKKRKPRRVLATQNTCTLSISD